MTCNDGCMKEERLLRREIKKDEEEEVDENNEVYGSQISDEYDAAPRMCGLRACTLLQVYYKVPRS